MSVPRPAEVRAAQLATLASGRGTLHGRDLTARDRLAMDLIGSVHQTEDARVSRHLGTVEALNADGEGRVCQRRFVNVVHRPETIESTRENRFEDSFRRTTCQTSRKPV